MDKKTLEDPSKSPNTVPGGAMLGCFVVGVAGLFSAAAAMTVFGDPIGAGLCLLASAFSFGLAANAVIRE